MSGYELLLSGLGALLHDPVAIGLLALGLLGGSVFGAIPGINMLTLGAVILPFTVRLEPGHAIMLYSVIYCSGVFGGAITAILFNIPGAPENAATAIDGHPMARQGQARRAIGVAILCSATGGIVSTLVMIGAAQGLARWAISAIQPAEIFGIVVLGLAISATVGAATIWKGWLSVLAGMLLATVGIDPVESTPRFTFGSYSLYAGFQTVPMILGVFALSEILNQSRRSPQGRDAHASGPPVGLAELWMHRVTTLRSIVIGFLSGLVPGVGATLAAFVSYGTAKALAGREGTFGRGDIRGVISAETANNAATGAAMIPVLALGLPGGALTAMMIGVYQLHGMEPGPLIFTNAPDIVGLVFAAMLLANVCILGLGWLEARTVPHLRRIDIRYLMGFLLVLSSIGAYAERNLMIDLWVMFGAGACAWVLRHSGYSLTGLVLGLILGRIGETAFLKAMIINDQSFPNMLSRPIMAICLALAATITLVGICRSLRVRLPGRAATAR